MFVERLLLFIARLRLFWKTSSFLRKLFWLIPLLIVFWIIAVLRAPGDFPKNKILTVRENAPIGEIADYLRDQHAISSPFLFNVFVYLLNPSNGVLSGAYYFDKPSNLITVAYRITKGKYELTPLALTIPEGSTVLQIADILAQKFPGFDTQTFIKLAEKDEGYLFPDTYRFLPNVAPKEILETIKDNFESKIISVEDEIRAFGRPLGDVIKMASYLEEEARLMLTRRMIAGILWKRLDEGMPLQIDASFQYVNGKNTYELSLDDLKIDSPYNTYKYKGLTPTPISSPGLEAITAAVTPIESRYYYFLSDKEGVMHYAVTHDEHVANKGRYLR